ncbi:MAG: hypothetical protein HC796_07185 [Synechococcaceae cyanobacterium RL_1_2]|nr:hypothetical protein [Synechococcaceae cyanobacterium RL_1_2]
MRSQFSVGLDIFDATEPIPSTNAQPDGKFVAWRGQAQYLKLLDRDTTFLIRGDVQLASEAVNTLEQFGLGGGIMCVDIAKTHF